MISLQAYMGAFCSFLFSPTCEATEVINIQWTITYRARLEESPLKISASPHGRRIARMLQLFTALSLRHWTSWTTYPQPAGAWQRANALCKMNNPEGVGPSEPSIVARACFPPVNGGVNDRINGFSHECYVTHRPVWAWYVLEKSRIQAVIDAGMSGCVLVPWYKWTRRYKRGVRRRGNIFGCFDRNI